jgi:hypothetical protein
LHRHNYDRIVQKIYQTQWVSLLAFLAAMLPVFCEPGSYPSLNFPGPAHRANSAGKLAGGDENRGKSESGFAPRLCLSLAQEKVQEMRHAASRRFRCDPAEPLWSAGAFGYVVKQSDLGIEIYSIGRTLLLLVLPFLVSAIPQPAQVSRAANAKLSIVYIILIIFTILVISQNLIFLLPIFTCVRPPDGLQHLFQT